MNELNDEYWSQRYLQHTDAWDLGEPSPPLKAYIDQLTDKNLRILIPGCGNAYEAQYLLHKGFKNITLVDISEVLVAKLQQQLSGTSIQIIHTDFFRFHQQQDLILEQTFFCALDPSLRKSYAQHVLSLLAPQGTLAGLLFDAVFESSPPFGGSKAEYQQLFSPLFHIKTMETCSNSVEARQNRELFFILKNKLA
ncbi:MAG TPA: methyltransferase domain-containing protein [Phnomibacter sp.]|nr:methyltransferase domain-containing protein [Phnomibacter sp.]